MTSEQVAQEAASRAGLQFTEKFQTSFVSQIECGSYQTDWTAENLPNILKKMNYFVFHPAHRQPIIDALVAMREEADSLVPHAFVRSSDARLPADLPAIISVHFANVAAPLVVSSLESLPPSFAEAPLLLSRFFSEHSRWITMKNTAVAAMADSECPRRAIRIESLPPSAPAPSRPLNVLELGQGPRDDLDVSRFASEGVVKFNSYFSTVRGPPFDRDQGKILGLCGYEIQVISTGPAPQFGFCTQDFPLKELGPGNGSGDDENSWAWDGHRHCFWRNGEAGHIELPLLSWSRGDILTFECDFSRNVTSVSVNGQKMHEHAFSPQLNRLYPAITSRKQEVVVNFGSRPFRFLRISSIPTPVIVESVSESATNTRWEWPSDQPPSYHYSDGGDCVNMAVYVKLAFPLLQHSHVTSQWARFLRCALYFSHATSAPQQHSKRALLLQVGALYVLLFTTH
jgi:hypothetical protein